MFLKGRSIADIWAFYKRSRTIYDIHGPGLFKFLSGITGNGKNYYIPSSLKTYYSRFRQDSRPLAPGDADSVSVGTWFRSKAVSPAMGSLYFRVSKEFRPERIITSGDPTGFLTAYISGGCLNAPCHAVAMESQCIEYARELWTWTGLDRLTPEEATLEEIWRSKTQNRTLLCIENISELEKWQGIFRDNPEALEAAYLIIVPSIFRSRKRYRHWQQLMSCTGKATALEYGDTGIIHTELVAPWRPTSIIRTRYKPWRIGLSV